MGRYNRELAQRYKRESVRYKVERRKGTKVHAQLKRVQWYKGTLVLREKGTKVQRYKGAEKIQRHKGTKNKGQRYKGTKVQRYKVTRYKVQRNEDTKRYKGTKEQRNRGMYKVTKVHRGRS